MIPLTVLPLKLRMSYLVSYLSIRIAPLPIRCAKLTYLPADTEMKAKIEAFKNEKKSAARAPITGLTNDEMDTSAG